MNGLSEIKFHISPLLKKINIKKISQAYSVLSLWDEIVGVTISKHSMAIRIVKGILYIAVDSSSWLNEIKFLKEDIISKYNSRLEQNIVLDIKFFIQKIVKDDYDKPEKKETLTQEKKEQEEQTIVLEDLSEDDKISIEKEAGAIEDFRLREHFIKFLEFTRKRELALLKLGWKICPICKSIHNSKKQICRVCLQGENCE